MNKLTSILIVTLLLVPLCGQGQKKQPSDEQLFLQSMHKNITSDKLYEYVKHLSDSTIFQGRLAGSPGMGRAVEWAQGLFKEWGLEELPGAPDYIQSFPHPCSEVLYGSGLSISLPVEKNGKKNAKNKEKVFVEKSYPWALGWYAGGTSGNGTVHAEIVYAGFGVTAPELGYDDYKDIDVKGKIVLIEGETPNRSRNADTLRMWYPYTLHQHKLLNAVKHGAVGMLYKWVAGPNNAYDPGFVYVYVNPMVVNDIFLGTGKTYKETVNKIYKTKQPQSFNTGKYATIKMNTVYNKDAKGKNVIGMVRGSDPKLADEYVIVSGHMDHLGMIPYHIAGANDNSSATAVLMGAAQALAQSKVKPKRSVIFMNLDGEEAGLTGSTYYVNNPLVPKEKVVAILNLEQVGVGENLNATCGIEHQEFMKYLKEANNKYVHRSLGTGTSRHITRPRTDGAVFMKADYPCADIGAYGGGWRGYYHSPKDDYDTINPEILQDCAKFIYWSAIMLANQE